MMSKYINADELKLILNREHLNYSQMIEKKFVLKAIDEMPSADVRENIHGEWIENDNGTYSCSLCQSWIPKEQYYYARYCLHCGADMRERKETDDRPNQAND